MTNASNEKRYDYIVVGAGAAGSVLATELSASGAQVLVIESGEPDDAPTIANPSIWFYNVGGPLDFYLPIKQWDWKKWSRDNVLSPRLAFAREME
jgi:choline dehydrogenase